MFILFWANIWFEQRAIPCTHERMHVCGQLISELRGWSLFSFDICMCVCVCVNFFNLNWSQMMKNQFEEREREKDVRIYGPMT